MANLGANPRLLLSPECNGGSPAAVASSGRFRLPAGGAGLRILGRHDQKASPRSRRAAAAPPSIRQPGSRSSCGASFPPRPRTSSSGSRPPTTPSSTSSTTSAHSSSRSTSSRRSSTIPRSSAASPRRTRSTTSSRWAARRCSRSRSPPFPESLPNETLAAIFGAADEQVRAAGGILAGGHTLRDDEPKYGLAVVGTVHPDGFWPKSGARPGDALFLTKPLGTGMLLHAAREGRRHEEGLEAAMRSMTILSREAADVLRPFDPNAVTDVTGFGLLGHAHEMAERSGVRIELDAAEPAALPRRARGRGGRGPDRRRLAEPRLRRPARRGGRRPGGSAGARLRPADLGRPADRAARGQGRGADRDVHRARPLPAAHRPRRRGRGRLACVGSAQ